jgi:hypothetical protein
MARKQPHTYNICILNGIVNGEQFSAAAGGSAVFCFTLLKIIFQIALQKYSCKKTPFPGKRKAVRKRTACTTA